jgi:hypothetical protein
VILNLHERWLLRTVGVRRPERRALLAALTRAGYAAGELDLLAQAGGYTLAKRSVSRDLAALFDQLMNPYRPRVHGVAFGNRRYRTPIILAAALHQAGISPATFDAGVTAGCHRLADFQALARSGPPESGRPQPSIPRTEA